jgi:hypothetical protein
MSASIAQRHLWALVLASAMAGFSALPTFPARAQDTSQAAGAPRQPNVDMLGDFEALQISTDDMAALKAAWSKHTPGASLNVTNKAVRGKQLVTFIIVRGSGADSYGKCDVTANSSLVDPSGKATTVHVPMPVCGGVPAPAGSFQLSRGNFAVTFDATDPSGIWQIKSTITDHITGKVLHTSQVITLGD